MGKRSSDSDSGGSRHKKRSHRRSRSPSIGKSSGESGASHHRKKSKSKKETRSPSKSKSIEKSRKHRHGRSPAPQKNSGSSSRSRSRKSRSHSPAHSSRIRHRSRSRSKEKTKHDKSSSRSREMSSKLTPVPEVPLTQDQQLKLKMQMALKAAAEADEQLRQKGILLSGKSEIQTKLTQPKLEGLGVMQPTLTAQEQISKAQAITKINAQGFEPSNFVSGRSLPQEELVSKSIMDSHDAVIFGTKATSKAVECQLNQKSTAAIESIIKDDLIHPNLFADMAAKQERWIRRLYNMRQKKLNGEAMS